MFDPEKVPTWDDSDPTQEVHPRLCVDKRDYDKLLELYRANCREFVKYIEVTNETLKATAHS